MTTNATPSPSAIPAHWLEFERLMSAADPSFAHRPAQAEGARIVHQALRSRTHAALDAPVGLGKGLALDTPILTEHGWSTMGTLSVGDRIHAEDGTLTEITLVSETKFIDCYRVTFSDGATFVCDAEHLWRVRDSNSEIRKKGKPRIYGLWRTVPITEIAEKFDLSKPGGNRRFRYSIHSDRVLQRPNADLAIDPYLLGWWLGNGSSHDTRITTHLADAEFLLDYITSLGIPAIWLSTPGKSAATLSVTNRRNGHRLRPPLRTDLQNLSLLRNKHIPQQYLLASADQRAALLAGLLDSDGHTSDGMAGEFTSTTEDLAYGVQFLLRSLGYKASIHEGRATLYGRDMGLKWRVSYSVSVDHHPYRSPRRIAQVTSTGSKQTTTIKIVNVERVESVPTRCIRVAHESHVFLAGESLTPTHNTAIALVNAQEAHGRTVISTATLALQSQIRDKDVPALQQAGVLTREVVILEGRGRYSCLNRTKKELRRQERRRDKGYRGAAPTIKLLEKVIKHLEKNPAAARRDSMPVAMPDWTWASICSDSDACGVMDCRRGSCAYTSLREQAREADIVVVNHSLLLADASIKNGKAVNWGKRPPTDEDKLNLAVLGPYRNLIIDEAHALENAAESFGEQRVTVRGIQALTSKVSNIEYSGAATDFLADCQLELERVMLTFPTGALLTPTGTEVKILARAADFADKAGKAVRDAGGGFDEAGDAQVLTNACYKLRDRLLAIDEALRTGSDSYGLRAVSVDAPRDGDPTGIRSQLVDASDWLIGNLFDNVTTVAMSGTLAVPGRRDWVTTRIGLDAKVEMLPTSFDLRSQRLVYVTPRVEDKSAMAARSTDADIREIEALIEASQGRALVLFSAVADLKFVHSRLHVSHTVLAQGVTTDGKSKKGDPIPASNATLAARFTADTSSVLLATRSFFEGVDFPGETCSMVIIVRFPNLRPDDPLTLARRNQLERRGLSAWVEYQEPAMQLIFRQAAGRAIRRVTDRGVVAVIDPRAGSKQYAKTALKSLAPSDYTDSLDDVREFLR